MTKVRSIAVVAVLMMLPLAGCGKKSASTTTTGGSTASSVGSVSGSTNPDSTSATNTGGAAEVKVTAKNVAFVPTTFSVKAGEAFSFRNDDTGFSHTFTLDDGSQGTTVTSPGQTSASITITAPGTYGFHCSIHSSMKGTVTVTP